MSEHVAKLHRLLRTERAGALSTLSLHAPGWPFGSIVPYALTLRAEPILVLSDLAEHTKNLRADPRASLLVTERAAYDDPQAGARATLVGTVRKPTDPAEVADARARYDARMPPGRKQLDTPDFGTYVLSVDEVRFIAGFGAIRWVSGTEVLRDPSHDPLAPHAGEILRHMNEDHSAAIGLHLAAFRDAKTDDARMTAIDAWGFDVTSPSAGRFHFDFDEPLAGPDDARMALVALVRAAREKLGVAR